VPDDEAAEGEKNPQSKAMGAMFERAKSARVSTENRPDPPIQLLAEPLMHFSDPEINILNAGLWAYGDGGRRPQALLKVEAHQWAGDMLPRVTWVHCFVSTSGDRIVAVWPNSPRFVAREAGLKLESFPKAPRPAESKDARLTQMKVLARRFSARCIDEAKVELEMRLLPTPVYRYADPEAGIQDGAVFAFCASGTNPTLVLLVELSQPQGKKAKWQYSLSRMTVREVTVKLDERVVYEQAYTGLLPVLEPSWMWSYEKGILPAEPEK
jgi:hypothetical protein